MEGVWYDYRLTAKLRDEAPVAYKDIRTVLKAQRELVKAIRIRLKRNLFLCETRDGFEAFSGADQSRT